ncbi:MAG: hypothetical protein WBB81_06660, partial [Pyrinomonadaceae bacterium]
MDENLIATLEQFLQQTRNEQNRLMARLREAENEVDMLRNEIGTLENSASQTEQMIDGLLVTRRSGSRSRSMNIGKSITIEDAEVPVSTKRERAAASVPYRETMPRTYQRDNPVSYIGTNRGIPSISHHGAAVSNRFNDRTITQACTLLLREAGGPLHVNDLYNMLISGGMKFKGNNPTISI